MCRLQEVPGEILRECQALQTLNLHHNPLTIEKLRETRDYREFDARRRAKYDKQVIRNYLFVSSAGPKTTQILCGIQRLNRY